MKLNIVFFGTPDIGLKSLEYLYNSPSFNVMAVVTQPDKPSGRGQKLTPSPIKRFAIENGIEVFQPKSIRKEPEVIEEADMVKTTEQQRAEFAEHMKVAEQTLSGNLKAIVYQDKDIDVSGLLDVVNDIFEKASNDVSLCDMLISMKAFHASVYRHSINVSLLGQVLAKWLDFADDEIECVSVAGLLHDIGILEFHDVVPNNEFFNDMWKNTNHHYERHVLNGYNKIKNKDIDYRIKQAILTHHERIDKSGYPMRVGIENMNKISRVIAIADTYDILTMHVGEEKTMSPLEVMKFLEDLSYSKLDPNMLRVFIDKVTNSYIQHEVLLSDGNIGKIIIINKHNIARPLVETSAGFIDLAVNTGVKIVKFL